MDVKIKSSQSLTGSIQVPSDKSLTHRAVLFSSLADGVSTIENPLEGEDCLSTLHCVEALGCRVERKKSLWTIHGVGLHNYKAPKGNLNCGNSGTTMRLLSGILAAQNFTSVLVGDDSLSKRPMSRVADPLKQMGAAIELQNGKYAPITIKASSQLKPIHWKNPVASAQVKSCVLLAGLHVTGETSFEEPSLSRDHTERMLAACGVPLKREDARVTLQGPAHLKPQHWVIPGDISSAAFFITAGLLVPGSRLRLTDVNLNPTRTGILDYLKHMGASFSLDHEREQQGEPVGDILVQATTSLKSADIDKSLVPRLIDEIPILAVLATQAKGVSHFRNIEELRVKETDRISAIAHNLQLMGADVKEEPDGLVITGPTPLKGATMESYDDHRIAMAFAVAGLIAEGETIIKGAECVSISFPQFWEILLRSQK